MRKVQISFAVATAAVLLTASMTNAARLPLNGVLPPEAHVHGYSLVDLARAWTEWGLSAGQDNPWLAGRCEQSASDPQIWFLPVSLGGDSTVTCDVPPGSFLVLSPGFVECSNVEDPPWYGGTPGELRACVDAGFAQLSYVAVTLDGRTATDLRRYALVTGLMDLPAGNLLASDPAISLSKGYFMVVRPLSRGVHTLRAYDESTSLGFQAGITFTIVVG